MTLNLSNLNKFVFHIKKIQLCTCIHFVFVKFCVALFLLTIFGSWDGLHYFIVALLETSI